MEHGRNYLDAGQAPPSADDRAHYLASYFHSIWSEDQAVAYPYPPNWGEGLAASVGNLFALFGIDWWKDNPKLANCYYFPFAPVPGSPTGFNTIPPMDKDAMKSEEGPPKLLTFSPCLKRAYDWLGGAPSSLRPDNGEGRHQDESRAGSY